MAYNWLDRIKVKPREYQMRSVLEMSKYSSALLQASTGSGKTNILIYLAFKLAKKTIIIVPKKDLVEQTYQRFIQCSDINPENIIKYNSRKPEVKPVTIITWQSLAQAMKSGEKWKLFENYFDVVICDEAHKTGAENLLYTMGVDMLNCKFKYGVSATPYRSDGTTRELIRFFDNNKIDIPIEEMYQCGALIRPTIEMIPTSMIFDARELLNEWEKASFSGEQQLGILKKEIGTNAKRNYMIRDYVDKTRRKCNLVLSYTTLQTDILFNLDHCDDNKKIKIYGKMGAKEKKSAMEYINNAEEITVYATQSFLGEGTDIPKLENLYITTPFAGGSKTVQFAGRVLRPCKNKDSVFIYDFSDKIIYNPYNSTADTNPHGWTQKRISEYSRLAPIINTENIYK